MKKFVVFTKKEAVALGAPVVEKAPVQTDSQMSPVYCPSCGSVCFPIGGGWYQCNNCDTILWGD